MKSQIYELIQIIISSMVRTVFLIYNLYEHTYQDRKLIEKFIVRSDKGAPEF